MHGIVSSYTLEWLSLLGRWTHLVTGIAWIGASSLFIWLDNHLLPPAERSSRPKGVAGELWAVHGGGFYHSQKYALAPPQLPRTLHWFYWEAYSTFLSGAFLLVLLYYVQADIYLVDPRVAALSRFTAVAIGVGAIIAGWIIYDALCRSALARHGAALGGVLAILFGAAAYGLCHVFSGRGAFIEFGAMLGSIMAANVFFVIIPGQRDLVAAQLAGRTPRSAQRPARQAALGAQHVFHAARVVHHDQQPLPIHFRSRLQLVGADRHVGGRTADQSVFRGTASPRRGRLRRSVMAPVGGRCAAGGHCRARSCRAGHPRGQQQHLRISRWECRARDCRCARYARCCGCGSPRG